MKNNFLLKKVLVLCILLFIQCNIKNTKKIIQYYDFPDEAEIDLLLQRESTKREIDYLFAKAVLMKESFYRKNIISSAGAVGLMQLMPRYGSYITENYKNYEHAKKQKGERIYKDKTSAEWIQEYKKELQEIVNYYSATPSELYKKDKRFDPDWNIRSGVGQLAEEYKFFINRKHSEYKSRILAAAAYNAGKYAVMKNVSSPKFDSIPINSQTEFYVIAVEKAYQSLKKNNGRLLKEQIYILY